MMTKTQLAQLYNISLPTIRKKLAELGFEKGRRLFTPAEVEQIMKIWGVPKGVRNV